MTGDSLIGGSLGEESLVKEGSIEAGLMDDSSDDRSQGSLKTLLVFGSYSESHLYPRNSTLVALLSDIFPRVIFLRPQENSLAEPKNSSVRSLYSVFSRVWQASAGFWSLFRQRHKLKNADLIYIPYPAYLDLIWLRIIKLRGLQVPVVVDAFICLHDTLVFDRALVAERSILARIVALIERRLLECADKVLIDTQAQCQQLHHRYQIPLNKFVVTPVGIDESLWQPLPKKALGESFDLLFWGTFIPLHGVETIIEAAALLNARGSKVRFTLVGDGQTADAVASLLSHYQLSNLVWRRELLGAKALYRAVQRAHLVLGIFGDTDKAGKVVPYKVHQALAANKPIITRSGVALEGLRKANAGSLMGVHEIAPADPAALAEAIEHQMHHYMNNFDQAGPRAVYDAVLSNSLIRQSLKRELEPLL